MATNTISIDCPNCGVSQDTGLCTRTTGSGGGSIWDDVICAVCFRNLSLVTGENAHEGDAMSPDEVIAEARRSLCDDFNYSEDRLAATALIAPGFAGPLWTSREESPV